MTTRNKILTACCVVIVAFGGGFIIGQRQEPEVRTETRIIEDTASKQKLVEALELQQRLQKKLETAEKTISDLKVSTKEKVRIVYRKDGTKIVEKEKSTDIDHKTDTSKNTSETEQKDIKAADNKTTEIETKTHTDAKTKTVSNPKDRFYVGVTVPVALSGVGTPGLEFKYRLFDLGTASVWTGAQADKLNPAFVLKPEGHISLGLTF